MNSIQDDLAAVSRELVESKTKMGIAGSIMAASLAVAQVMRADVWRVVAAKRLVKITQAYTASILAAADQLNEELKMINGKRTEHEKRA